jgi:hypothetical protein
VDKAVENPAGVARAACGTLTLSGLPKKWANLPKSLKPLGLIISNCKLSVTKGKQNFAKPFFWHAPAPGRLDPSAVNNPEPDGKAAGNREGLDRSERDDPTIIDFRRGCR